MHFVLAAESSGGLSALGINLSGLIFQLINFGILYYVLQRWVFPPILRLLEQRRKKINDGLRNAEEATQALAAAEQERQQVLDEARKEASELVEAARSQAAREAQRITAEAHAASNAAAEEAERRIAHQRQTARAELMSELGEVVATATAAVTRRELTPKADAAVIERALQEAG
jgi:F-type H+-transporting ATPase subunit b